MSPITSTLSSSDSIVGSVSQGTQSQVTRIVVPSTNSLSQLTDVDITTLNDGSVLQYNTTSTSWVAKTEITSDMTLNGGNF
jgi:hypothetical protein|tara:strand:+ start:402 stop:644 length:243 start_codon:yes stop_codon:yes gene_type:complete